MLSLIFSLRARNTDQWLLLCCSWMNPDRVSLCVKHPCLHAEATPKNNSHCCCFLRSFSVLLFWQSLIQQIQFVKELVLGNFICSSHQYPGASRAMSPRPYVVSSFINLLKRVDDTCVIFCYLKQFHILGKLGSSTDRFNKTVK